MRFYKKINCEGLKTLLNIVKHHAAIDCGQDAGK